MCVTGVCRIPCCCCCDPKKKLRYERVDPTTTYGGRRLSRASSETLTHHRRQRAWQWRMQCMFCWLRLRGEQRTAFADVAATLADAFNQFRGYVPSDIVAGIALYALHHEIVSLCSECLSVTACTHCPQEYSSNVELRKPLDFDNAVSCLSVGLSAPAHSVLSQLVSKHFNRAVHYMRFAAAAYGNSAYLHHKGLLWGCMKLTGCCTYVLHLLSTETPVTPARP